jgi:MOSC domain-containing protein YiiM
VLEVTMPRSPCDSLSRRCGVPDMLERVRATRRIGWLYRVVREGYLESGAPVVLVDRPHAEWSVAAAFDVMARLKEGDASAIEPAAQLASCAALGRAWRDLLHTRSAKLQAPG